jgi:hypothetical protein
MLLFLSYVTLRSLYFLVSGPSSISFYICIQRSARIINQAFTGNQIGVYVRPEATRARTLATNPWIKMPSPSTYGHTTRCP